MKNASFEAFFSFGTCPWNIFTTFNALIPLLMSLESLLQFMIPKYLNFLPLIIKAAAVSNAAVALLLKLDVTASGEERDLLLKQIYDSEHEENQITHDKFLGLNTNFVTPLDRGHIHELVYIMDNVIAQITVSAYTLYMYNYWDTTSGISSFGSRYCQFHQSKLQDIKLP